MPEFKLEGSSAKQAIGDGYSIAFPTVTGTLQTASGRGEKSRGFFDEKLDSLLEDAGLNRDKVIRITPEKVVPGTRGLADTHTLSLSVPRDADTGALVLLEDPETGSVSWHLPVPKGRGISKTAAHQFELPVNLGTAASQDGSRGFGIPSVVVKVFTYVAGKIVAGYARKWEQKNRPYLIRTYGPGDYTDMSKNFPALDAAGWQRMGSGRALLFVHGTFSSAGAFSDLPPAVMQALSAKYEGRLFAFNHFTLSDDPANNAEEFFKLKPADVTLDVDIICHSRGGLVARELVRHGLDAKKIIFVAAANSGTALADKDHVQKLLDRFTTFAKLLPGNVQLVVDAIVVALEVIAGSLLGDLKGLASMDPEGDYLKALNMPGGTAVEGYAIASNFEPKAGTPWFKMTRLENAGIDAVFGQNANDLVVPRDGVFSGFSAAGFPIEAERCLLFGDTADGGDNDAVIHTQFFSETRTQAAIVSWLTSDQAPRELTASRGVSEMSIGDLESLRPHIVNMSNGLLRQSGKYSTKPADVDAIFATHIPAWMTNGGSGKPLRMVFFAHGGLVNEQDGLGVAKKHVDWWKSNGIYPIYFVWETGLFDALRAILEETARQIPGVGSRGFADDLTDHLIEKGVRAFGGPKVWQAMKTNAALSSEPSGGAHYVAGRLKEFCDATPGAELHAVGHSAGSIFHSWFLPMASQLGVPAFASMQLLAPAIRIDEFVARLRDVVGPSAFVRTARIFAMSDRYERDDNCISIYRKSLLYLIYHALEAKNETPILGLETSVADDPDIRQFFTPASGGPASAIWSVTPASAPANVVSHSTSHGGFDDDRETMSSVAAHILSQPAATVPYPGSRSLPGDWPIAREWKRGYESGQNEQLVPADDVARVSSPSTSQPAQKPVQKPAQTSTSAPAILKGGGRRSALCVGIDTYRGHELTGCVADSKAWANALHRLDFDVTLLNDKNATFEGILDKLRTLITSARAGDVVAFQYAGHGYQLPDLDGDEDDHLDEAFVPIDFDGGGFVLDDDVRDVLSLVKSGVSLTCFVDSCNSGTITRVFDPTRNVDGDGKPRGSVRVRYLKTSPSERDTLESAHQLFRTEHQKTRSFAPRAQFGKEDLRWVTFSACQPWEQALERDGRGDFSVHAIDVLSTLRKGATNTDFQDAVVSRFGPGAAQKPYFDRRSLDDSAAFLGGIIGG